MDDTMDKILSGMTCGITPGKMVKVKIGSNVPIS